ncbi:hypothetical protein H2200_006070 [Cladophialophora chaetospira]|uniref:Beta-lactamase-related domain-containing protein n=1 Tax=Cladophialophora chaetospira TaxID=386627 RepID=A0AA38XA90_9EURO|nr:hypothetical protein H2200_006070 [Cladophialophora chaetospira]
MAPLSRLGVILLFLSSLIAIINGSCSFETPFFPPPTYTRQSSEVWEAFSQIEASLSRLMSNSTDPGMNKSSYSIEVTSSKSTLWSTFHTAKDKNLTRPGAEKVNETSRYRIASITKVFTVLGILQQHAAGNLSLDHTIDRYLPDLNSSHTPDSILWHDITLRSLASQLSGIPRDWAQGDLILDLEDPTAVGLPPVSRDDPEFADLPRCDSYNDFKPCTAQDLFRDLEGRPPVFEPNQKGKYSNIAFELLGLALANVTGQAYEVYVGSSILQALGMAQTSFSKPDDSVAVLPKDIAWYWDVDEGVQNPTGGLYCSSSDMSMFLRYVLKDYKNIVDAKLNWLPLPSTIGVGSYYGMPWETLRTDKILDGGRTVTFFTKGGGLPGYSTMILVVPQYDLGITIFAAGDTDLLSDLLKMVVERVIEAADKLAGRQVDERYAGTYTADPNKLNSSVTLSYSSTHGLEITNWISNSTDMLKVISQGSQLPPTQKFHAQLISTGLHRHEKTKKGELWRLVVSLEEPAAPSVWDDLCTGDVDTAIYAGKPLNELAFWDKDEKSGRFYQLELTAFRVNLTLTDGGGGLRIGHLLGQQL